MSQDGYIKSALFVDFDNIFINLDREQAEAAEYFATEPDRWLHWIEHEEPVQHRGMPQRERRILERRCYINPKSFHRYRGQFIRSGFEVVDCPPLTLQGKTSADIHMVLDILDALANPTHFDEFIILSGDADFTPVLLRLRKHDRRTLILAIGFVSPAYKSAADRILNTDAFLEKGLGIEDSNGNERHARQDKGSLITKNESVLKRMAEKVEDTVSMIGRAEAVDLPGIYKEFSEFKKSDDWLGFGSLRNLTEAIVAIDDRLSLVDDDPWWIGHAGGSDRPGEDSPSQQLPSRQELGERIRNFVKAKDHPVVLAAVAHDLNNNFGSGLRLSKWLNTGSFKNLVEQLDLGKLRVSSEIPGYIFDPDRHEDPARESLRENRTGEDVPRAARQISRIGDIPSLSAADYAAIFREIMNEVNENGYHLTRTSKNVRDRCNGKGIPVARSHINFILKGIVFSGYRFRGDGQEDVTALGNAFANNVLSLSERAQMELSAEDEREIRELITGGLD